MYMVASQFNLYMIRMQLSISLASDIILEVAKRAKLDSERTCNLLAELSAN